MPCGGKPAIMTRSIAPLNMCSMQEGSISTVNKSEHVFIYHICTIVAPYILWPSSNWPSFRLNGSGRVHDVLFVVVCEGVVVGTPLPLAGSIDLPRAGRTTEGSSLLVCPSWLWSAPPARAPLWALKHKQNVYSLCPLECPQSLTARISIISDR